MVALRRASKASLTLENGCFLSTSSAAKSFCEAKSAILPARATPVSRSAFSLAASCSLYAAGKRSSAACDSSVPFDSRPRLRSFVKVAKRTSFTTASLPSFVKLPFLSNSSMRFSSATGLPKRSRPDKSLVAISSCFLLASCQAASMLSKTSTARKGVKTPDAIFTLRASISASTASRSALFLAVLYFSVSLFSSAVNKSNFLASSGEIKPLSKSVSVVTLASPLIPSGLTPRLSRPNSNLRRPSS